MGKKGRFQILKIEFPPLEPARSESATDEVLEFTK